MKSLGWIGLFAVIWVTCDDLTMINTSLYLGTCCCVKNDVLFPTQVTVCDALQKDIHSPRNRCKKHKWTDLSCSSEIWATHKADSNNQECLAYTLMQQPASSLFFRTGRAIFLLYQWSILSVLSSKMWTEEDHSKGAQERLMQREILFKSKKTKKNQSSSSFII